MRSSRRGNNINFEKEKNEDSFFKIFSTWPKYLNSYFSEALNFADFKYSMYSDFSIFQAKVTALQR